MLISIVLCTYNRAELLLPLLQEFANQSREDDAEFVIVDNNSTDQTSEVCSDFMRQNPKFRYIKESRQGLSYARNAGVNHSRGEYVCFIDDDCFPCSDWIAVARDIISNVAPGVFGGPYFAKFDNSKPQWYKESYESHVQGDSPRELNSDEYLDGGNCGFRKALIVDLGGFDVNLGMRAEEIGYGEETEMLMRIRSRKPREVIYYDPRFYVYNLVRPEKMRLSWILRQRFISGRHNYRIFRRPESRPLNNPQFLRAAAKTTVLFVIDLLRGIFNRDRSTYPYLQNHLVESTFRHAHRLGMLYEQRSSNQTG